jgi:hypothetical protein
VRRRLLRLRTNPDFKAQGGPRAEELEKASGGGECKECRGYAQQCNGALNQQLEVFMDWQLSQKKYSPARIDYEARVSLTCKIPSTAWKGVINSIKRSRRTKGTQLSH